MGFQDVLSFYTAAPTIEQKQSSAIFRPLLRSLVALQESVVTMVRKTLP